MTANEQSRTEAWTAPARPEWVSRINAEGDGLDLRGVVPLDAPSLIAAATANTGLSDFGEDDWRAPFERLLQSYNEESGLSLMGRIMTRSDILTYLEGRLRVEDMYRRHPEIEDEQIRAPIWIMGQGRTGTSMLQKLLALDPGNRTLNTYDALFPVVDPTPAGTPDPRIARADHLVTMWNRVTPEVLTVHDFGGSEPSETIVAEAMSFQTPAWLNLFGLAPSYTAMMAERGQLASLRYGKRVLKLIQWQNPGRQWILKSPDALTYMPSVIEVFPDVRFVWTHRDPVRALSSAVNLIGTLAWVRSDRKLDAGVFDFVTDPHVSAQDLTRPIDWIESGALPRAQLRNIQYDALVEDPIAEIAGLYAYFGMPFTDEAKAAITAYIDAHPRSARATHRYDTGDQQRIARERALYAQYQAYFDVPSEL